MTQEEKAERYDELAKEVKDFFKGKQKMPNDAYKTLEHLFPELKDSEDERIRKAIISGMTAIKCQGKEIFADARINDIISWLEKQGEQKPTEWSEEDEERIKNTLSVLDAQVCWDGATMKKRKPYQKEIDWLKSLKDRVGCAKEKQWKPSDGQIEVLKEIIADKYVLDAYKGILKGLQEQLIKLKG